MNSLLNDVAIEKIKILKKAFLWMAVCILIGEVVVGAFLILLQTFNLTIGKLMGTFALCAVALLIGVDNFTKMEKGEGRLVQSFALLSLVMNFVWLILAILLIWEIAPFMERGIRRCQYCSYGYHATIVLKMMILAIDLAMTGFFISNVWDIKETVKPVRPLKITALICELYCGIYAAMVVFFNEDGSMFNTRWYALAGLMGFAFVVMAFAALMMSRSGKKNNEEMTNSHKTDISDSEMQVKIQEMVEKEVQARLEAAQKASSANEVEVSNAGSDESTYVEEQEQVSEEPGDVEGQEQGLDEPGDIEGQEQIPDEDSSENQEESDKWTF